MPIVGWKVRTPRKAKSVPPAPSKPKPVDHAYERQKLEWLQEVRDAGSPVSISPRPSSKPHGLLDDISDDLSPEDRYLVILTRLDHMRDA